MFSLNHLRWQFCFDISFALLLTFGAVAAVGFSA
jgi:hypothetical protein